MAQQTGARSAMVIGFESTFGSAPATGMKMLFNTSSLKGTRPLNSPATLRGNRNPVMPFRGNMDVSGDIVVPVDSDAFGWWLKAMFGAPTTAGAGPYTHTYKVGDTQPSIAVEHQFLALDTPQYFLYEGCKVSTFAMEIGGDGELVATLSMVGATETIDTSSFDGTATEKAINRLHNFHASLTEGGSAFADATTVSLNVEFGLDTEQFVIGGGGVRGAIPEGVVVVSGQLTALFKDITLLNKAINETESSLLITIEKSTNEKLDIEIPELQYQQNSPEISGPQGILVTLDFQGYYEDDADASAIVAVLTNSIETYA